MGGGTRSSVTAAQGGRSQRRSKRDRAERDGSVGVDETLPSDASASASGAAIDSTSYPDDIIGGDTIGNEINGIDGDEKVKDPKIRVGGRRAKKIKTENNDVKITEGEGKSEQKDINQVEVGMTGSRESGSREVNVLITMNGDLNEMKAKPSLRAKLNVGATIRGSDVIHGDQQQQQQQQKEHPAPPQSCVESNDPGMGGRNEETISGDGSTTTTLQSEVSGPPPPPLDEIDSSTKTSTSSPPNNKKNNKEKEQNKNSNTPKGSKYCAHESCTKYRQTGCYGYCLTHKLIADPDLHAIKRNIAEHSSDLKKRTLNKSNLCKWPSCTKYIQSNCNGYCLTHVKYANYEEGDVYEVTKVRVRIASRLQNGFCRAILPLELRDRWGFDLGDGAGIKDSPEDNDGGEDSPLLNDNHGDSMGGTPRKLSGSVSDSNVGDVIDGENNDSESVGGSNHFLNDSMIDIPVPETSNGASSCQVVEHPETSQDVHGNVADKMENSNDGVLGWTAEGSFRTLRTCVPAEYVAQLSMEPLLNERGRSLCNIIGCGKLDQSNNDGFCRMHFHMFEVREKSDDDWMCGCGLLMAGTQKRCGTCNKWRGGKRESYDVSKSETQSEDADDDGEPWTCECGNEVASKKSRCGSCHRWRGGKRQGGWTLGAGKDYDSDDGIDRTQEWTCCGDIISAKQTRCGKCNGWRGGKRVCSSAGAEASNKSPPPNIPSWVCIKCQMTNPGNKKRCGGCLTWKSNAPTTSKPSKGSRRSSANRDSTDDPNAGGHWKCMSCNFDNFSRELSCFICKSMRPNHQWHKKQQVINSTPVNSTHYPSIQATTVMTPTLATPTTGAVPPAPDSSAALSHTNSISTLTNQGVAADSNRATNNGDKLIADIISNPPDTLNYYGTYNESLIYPYISIHYDFNRAYYYNHDYTYLNAGVGGSHGAGGDDVNSNERESK